MDLLRNPFNILNATPIDNRRRIFELREERSLVLDPGECSQAESELTNPRKRLSAEIAWLPGLGPTRTKEVLTLLDYYLVINELDCLDELLCLDELTPMARANLLAEGLLRLNGSVDLEVIVVGILELASTFEDVDPQGLCSLINLERAVSGFPQVTDIYTVEEEIQERRRYYRQVIKSALNNLNSKDRIKAVKIAVEEGTGNGEEHSPILIDDLVDSYEVEAQSYLANEAIRIEELVKKIRQTASRR